jgi:hypothetical protein
VASATLHRVGKPADLVVDGVAEPQPLVPEVAHQFREFLVRCVDVPDGFEEGKREEGVYGGSHGISASSCTRRLMVA